MENKYHPCSLRIFKNSSFIGFKNKRIILDEHYKFMNNTILERDWKLDQDMKTKLMIKINKNTNISHYKNVFLFTESYGDRNICHWFTEQLMVLNYLVDLLKRDNNNDSNINTIDNTFKIIINKNRRTSMITIIKDYLLLVPNIDETNILELDLQDFIHLRCNTLYLGNAIKCDLKNIYPLWNSLHSNLKINTEFNNNLFFKYSKKIYMSRRNIYQPNKQTNTRLLINFDEISNIIVRKGYQEVFTDEIKNIKERIYLFQNLDEIICELGAGIHNLLYCKEGIELTVLYQNNNISWLQEYYPLFINKKFKVKIITGKTLNNNHNGNWLNTPWYLQPESLTSI